MPFGLPFRLPFGLCEWGVALVPAPDTGTTTAFDISWVDEFIDNVRPYIFVRTEDNILIRRPNMAQKLNPSGGALLEVPARRPHDLGAAR